MSHIAQAMKGDKSGFSATSPLCHAFVLSVMLGLSGCASGGLEMLGVGIDKDIKTRSTNGQSDTSAAPQSEVSSDEVTVRNAVSSINLAEWGERPLSWANVSTGSQGAITTIDEFETKGVRCRRFVASRESFDGITLYDGEICLQGNGVWVMHKFEPVST